MDNSRWIVGDSSKKDITYPAPEKREQPKILENGGNAEEPCISWLADVEHRSHSSSIFRNLLQPCQDRILKQLKNNGLEIRFQKIFNNIENCNGYNMQIFTTLGVDNDEAPSTEVVKEPESVCKINKPLIDQIEPKEDNIARNSVLVRNPVVERNPVVDRNPVVARNHVVARNPVWPNLAVNHPRNREDVLELVQVLPRANANLPPAGVLIRRKLVAGSEVWVMQSSSIDVFVEGTILSSCSADNSTWYKIRFDETRTIAHKLYTAKQLAYRNNPDVIVAVGTRIAARYSDGEHSKIYAGVVAEPPKCTNHERYLVFFEDGYAQYIEHRDIYVMCEQSIDVADDINEEISDFIRTYLQEYPERPMLKLQVGQVTKTEYIRKWWDTKVMEVDASMVKMVFLATSRTEWLYRGSMRLKLLYHEINKAKANRLAGKYRSHNPVARTPHQPYVEYTRDGRVPKIVPNGIVIDTIDLDSGSDDEDKNKSLVSQRSVNVEKPRNTARKSTSLKPRQPEGPSKSYDIVKGGTEVYNFDCISKAEYKTHRCSALCREKPQQGITKRRNLFELPLLHGWVRELISLKANGPKLRIIYRAPCGKKLRELKEVLHYLITVQSSFTIDLFSFDPYIHACRSFQARDVKYEIDDITNGMENVPVSCVNSFEDTPPPYVEYAAKRFPGQGVDLNEDIEFLSGCSCTDDCQNSLLCDCQQIASLVTIGRRSSDFGYEFRRLKKAVINGVYECNKRCKCGPQCANRVVQQGMKVRLQLFNTERKGWGIRALHDIEAGMFICIYAGQLLTDQEADVDGHMYGDEYLAELDHIEIAERHKDGYQSEVSDIEDMNGDADEDYNAKDDEQSSDSDVNVCDTDSEYESSLRSTAVKTYTTRSRRKCMKISNSLSASSMDSVSNNAQRRRKSNNKELPDLTSSLDTFKLTPRPLSPESEDFLEKNRIKKNAKNLPN